MVLVESVTSIRDEEILSVLEDAVFYKKLATGRYLKINSLEDLRGVDELFKDKKSKKSIKESKTDNKKTIQKSKSLLEQVKGLL